MPIAMPPRICPSTMSGWITPPAVLDRKVVHDLGNQPDGIDFDCGQVGTNRVHLHRVMHVKDVDSGFEILLHGITQGGDDAGGDADGTAEMNVPLPSGQRVVSPSMTSTRFESTPNSRSAKVRYVSAWP